MIATRYPAGDLSNEVARPNRSQTAFLLSNGVSSVAGRMQLLLQGWLVVAWGHHLVLLFAFAAARIAPKLILTVPAGLICDRLPRTRVLAAARWLDALACMLPLAGFVLPLPLAWLIVGIALSGATAAFDQPARKATVGDITEPEDLGPLVALNNGTAHLSALVGTGLALALGPSGLVLAAILLASGAFLARYIEPAPAKTESKKKEWDGVGGFLRFVMAAPLVAGLVILAITPLLVNKAMALALPSFHESPAILSLALVAPEIGGIVAAAALFLRPVTVPIAGLIAGLAFYALVLTAGMSVFAGSALLVAGMALGGICQTAFDTTSQVRIQQLVPRDLRGRVFAF